MAMVDGVWVFFSIAGSYDFVLRNGYTPLVGAGLCAGSLFDHLIWE